MATIKAYTNIVQSCKLAEILSHESADMYYKDISLASFNNEVPNFAPTGTGSDWGFPCWSLAALLNVISKEVSLNSFKDGIWNVMIQQNDKMIYSDADNLIDACYEFILKLHKLNLL